jgi:cytidylate kinase
MTVITISRQYGSGGDEIAIRLCEILGYSYFDKSLISQAAAAAGISEKDIFDYSEDSHKVRSFLDRLFDRPMLMVAGRMWDDAGAMLAAQDLPLSDDDMLTLVQKAIHSAYQNGNIVIVGRGSQVLLRDKPNVVHVRIVAPLEDRIQRLKDEMKQNRQAYDADLSLRREAQDFIVERDAASADYIKRYYAADWNDAQLYHMVLNTGKMDLNRAAEMIVSLVQNP